MANRLNQRFRNGQATNNIRKVGVFVRQIDAESNMNKPYLPCPDTQYCSFLNDRWSGSIINADTRHVYNTNLGFVLAPTANLSAAVMCSYPGDGGTQSKRCSPPGVRDNCKPGCYFGSPNWCPNENHWWGCNGYPRSRLYQMLTRSAEANRYNEVVLDIQSLMLTWPEGIEAVFYITDKGKSSARQVQRQLVQDYGEAAASIPILKLDLATGGEEGTPFAAT